MGRLSAYAKNRILKLRFKKNKRIIHIVEILRKEDNIKVSRQAVSTFLKKYLETNSIYDKPRTGRKRKLSQEEIQLIGQVTRLNRDITARAIKEYLNLSVSTYTILRATKLFEWNKVNPNSNDSKKQAALERQLNGESSGTGGSGEGAVVKRRRSTSTSGIQKKPSKKNKNGTSMAEIKDPSAEAPPTITTTTITTITVLNDKEEPVLNATASVNTASLNGAEDEDKIKLEDEVVETIKITTTATERASEETPSTASATVDIAATTGTADAESNSANVNLSNDNIDQNISEIEKIQEKLLLNSTDNNNTTNNESTKNDETDKIDTSASQINTADESANNGPSTSKLSKMKTKKPHGRNANSIPELEKVDLNLIQHNELFYLKNQSCSPMSFATKILFKIFKLEELHGHNVSGKTLNRNLKAKLPLDPVRIGYIKFLVEKYYDEKECKEIMSTQKLDLWKSCHTAINKSILISERKAQAALASGKPFSLSHYNDSTMMSDFNNSSFAAGHNGEKDKRKADGDDSSSESDGSDFNSSKELVSRNKKLLTKKKVNTVKKVNKKKLKKSKQYSFSSSTSSSSSGSDFDANLESEEFDTGSDNDDDLDKSKSSVKNKLAAKNNFKKEKAVIGKSSKKVVKEEASTPNKRENVRRSQRQRKPTYKLHSSEFDDDESNDEDSIDERDKHNQDDEDDNQNEIELIQNIESRLTNTASNNKSESLKLPISAAKNSNQSTKLIATAPSTAVKKNEQDNHVSSSEASAAANIAAAMKKRFVVVASNTPHEANSESDQQSPQTSTNSVNQQSTSAKSSAQPKATEKSTNKKTNSQLSPAVNTVRQLPRRNASINEKREPLSSTASPPASTTSSAKQTPKGIKKEQQQQHQSEEKTNGVIERRTTRSSSGRPLNKK